MYRTQKKEAIQAECANIISQTTTSNTPTSPSLWTKALNTPSALPLQTQLTVNQPGDEYEQEADRVANQVMRMAHPVVQRRCACGGVAGADGECAACKAKRSGLQRQTALDEEEGVIQTKRASGAVPTREAPASVHDTIRSSGQPLDATSRAFMENSFGQDFSHVRVHTNSQAAQSAADVDARAYTVGNNVVFGSGQYAPQSSEGQKLIAHELTHVIQQGASYQSGKLQRFGSDEHVEIGNRVAPGRTIRLMGGSAGTIDFSYGEFIAVSGDYFGSLQEMDRLAHDAFGRDELILARWKVNPSRPRPTVAAGVEASVQTRYDRLASRNETHFTTGSAPGRSNREQYIELHTRAIRSAWLAGASPLTVQQFFPETIEAFSNHFLTDAFSAGHIRTPRGSLKLHWDGLYPNFVDNLIDMISCYMAAYIRDVDNVTWPVRIIRWRIRPRIVALAGARLSAFSIGDLLSKAMHDADNSGLDVVSPSGIGSSASPFRWPAVGGEHLYPATPNSAASQTQQMVEEAVRLSLDEVSTARSAGIHGGSTLSALTNPANYRALRLIPQEDTASTTNPSYPWQVANIRALNSDMRRIINNLFAAGAEIRVSLDAVTVPPLIDGRHAGDAWDCFKRHLLADPFAMIINACEGNICPPGNNNPCAGATAAPAATPTPATTSSTPDAGVVPDAGVPDTLDDPRDAGVPLPAGVPDQ